MLCPDCRTHCQADDDFCRRCGSDLSLPSTSLVPVAANLPEITRQHSPLPRLAAGVGALAVGFGLELLRRNLIGRLEKPLRSTSRALTSQALMGMRDGFGQPQTKTLKLPKGYAIEETAIYVHRVVRSSK